MIPLDTIEILLDDVYRLGLGVTRRHSLEQMQPLSYSDLPGDYSPREEAVYTAEFIHLGGRLADRAFQNMPPKFRRYAAEWSGMDTARQEQVLHEIMQDLSAMQWRALRNKGYFTADELRGLDSHGPLPAFTKSWQRGRHMPNCLGMAHMLVGFARAAGARHRLVTPIVSPWYSAMVLQRKQVAYNLRQLDTFPDAPYVRDIRRRLRRLDERTLSAMSAAVTEAAHHALAIELADGIYRIVDPYMNVFDAIRVDSNVESMATLWRARNREQGWIQFSLAAVERAVADCVAGKRLRSRVERAVGLVYKDRLPLRTKRQREQFYKEVLLTIIDYCSAYVTNMAAHRPVVYEDSNAAFSLAAYTVNHWSVATGVQCVQVAIEAPHQHIIRDQMEAINSAPSVPTLPLPGMSEMEYLPELRPYLVKEEGVTHGSEKVVS